MSYVSKNKSTLLLIVISLCLFVGQITAQSFILGIDDENIAAQASSDEKTSKGKEDSSSSDTSSTSSSSSSSSDSEGAGSTESSPDNTDDESEKVSKDEPAIKVSPKVVPWQKTKVGNDRLAGKLLEDAQARIASQRVNRLSGLPAAPAECPITKKVSQFIGDVRDLMQGTEKMSSATLEKIKPKLTASDYMIGDQPLLHYLIDQERDDLVQRLITVAQVSQLDVNGTDADIETALHKAARRGNLQLIKQLVHLGANKKLRNNANKTALQLYREIADETSNDHIQIDVLLGGNITAHEIKALKARIKAQDDILKLQSAEFKTQRDASLRVIQDYIDKANVEQKGLVNTITTLNDIENQERVALGNRIVALETELAKRDENAHRLKFIIIGGVLFVAAKEMYARRNKIKKKVVTFYNDMKKRCHTFMDRLI